MQSRPASCSEVTQRGVFASLSLKAHSKPWTRSWGLATIPQSRPTPQQGFQNYMKQCFCQLRPGEGTECTLLQQEGSAPGGQD